MTASLALPSGLPRDRVLQLLWPIPSGSDSLLAPQPSRILSRPLPVQAVITGLGLLWLQEALPLSVGGETGSATQQASPLPEASQDHRPLVCWEQSQGQNCALEPCFPSPFAFPG